MGAVIVGTVALALAVAISPTSISAAILVLLSDRARLAGLMYLAGYAFGITLATVVGLLVGRAVDLDDRVEPPTVVSVIVLAGGLVLFGLASWTWQNRPKNGSEPVLPRWLQSIESLPPYLALGLGFGLAVFNFKNLGLILVATLGITQAEISDISMVLLSIAFVLLACLGVAVPVGWLFLRDEHATERLGEWREWLTRHNTWVTALSTALGGLLLVGKGLLDLFG